jgi:hypothetical protein
MQVMPKILLGCCVIAAIFSACSGRGASNLPITLKGGALSAAVYDSGKPAVTGLIPAGSAALDTIEEVLVSKNGQWQSSIVTFAPVILISAPTFTLNFQENRVAANFKDASGRSVQRVTPLSKEQYEQVRKAVTEAVQPPKK